MEDNKTTMASEPVAAYPMTSYNDVMSYLHSIRIAPEVKASVGRRLLVEVTEPYLSKAFDRIDHLSLLNDDWDGYGAKKISYHVLRNLRDVLLISDNDDWENRMISPAPDGTIALQSKCHTSSISVGDKEFSYYSAKGDMEDWGDNVTFTPNSFLEVMRTL
jgi:hypothetical protein